MTGKHPTVAVIGAGPAGLAAAGALGGDGFDVVVLDQGSIADGVRRWPYYLKFFSTAPNLELAGFPLIVRDEKPSREEYLAYLRRYVREKRIDVRTGHRVDDVARAGDGFIVRGVDDAGATFEIPADYIVLATGAYDHPQLLGVPGEDLPKVSHYFTEVHPYAFRKVAVIGGKSSAAECALLLQRAEADVTLIHRGDRLEGLKYWIQPDIENRIRNGKIMAYFGTNVIEILPRSIRVRVATGEVLELENDFVLAMTGYEPDTELLRRIGVEFDPATKRPRHDPATLESSVPGIFLAGVILSGNVGGEIFIENSRHHGAQILAALRARP
jgi:thioredoxin reductase (NADPH)